MSTPVITIFILFLQFNHIWCHLDYGSVFPIPLVVLNETTHFEDCPIENGVYAHKDNCSLFHMCNLGIHSVYACIDGFFFNPNDGRCQHMPVENEVQCEIILQKMMDTNLIQSVIDYDYDYRRKSATSNCTQTGIYTDVLDCSLFHYCRENQQHEIFHCPNELHFDPKTFMCSSPELVDCQYEPSVRMEDKTDRICRDHPPGTYLPVVNRFDMYIICTNDGRSISMRCKFGFIYNALTTACEKGPCTFDSTLCKNDGHCIDDSTQEKGFQCVCPREVHGEYCEKVLNLEETTEQAYTEEIAEQNSENLSQKSVLNETTHIPYMEKINDYRNNQSETTEKVVNNLIQEKPWLDSSFGQQQQILKILFIIIVTIVGIMLLGSIIFGIVTLTRVILYAPVETVNEWKTLHEESNI